ncbi:MAG: DUF393 domain-containing protein [Bacteroidetes bacterium]|nr:DUF393 domain-containing protein [Bacteroidota bacterium]
MDFILFDGNCSRCNGFASFIEKRVQKTALTLVPLETEEGKSLLIKYQLPMDYQESVVYISKNKAYTHSTAALYSIMAIKKWYRLAYIGFLIPQCIRDYFYNKFARARNKNSCKI